jgi:FtsP/CotA-like multicopper oxidase with cupredoxin domain
MPGKKSKVRTKRNYIRNFFIALTAFVIVWFLFSLYADVNPKWQEPPRLKSVNGILNVTLKAQKSAVTIGGKKMITDNYNGTYPPATWDVQKGDIVKVHLINDLTQPTNLHFHGSHVSPKGNSDNVLLTIKPGETFDY